MQRVNMDLDKNLWKEVGIRAATEGITKKELVEKALTEYLKKEIDEMKRPDTSHYQNPVYFYTIISHNGTLEESYQFPTADEAYEAAEEEWSRLVPQDKKTVKIIVGVKEDDDDKPDCTPFAEFPKA